MADKFQLIGNSEQLPLCLLATDIFHQESSLHNLHHILKHPAKFPAN